MKKLSLAVFAVLALATLMFVYGQAPTQITGAGAPSNPCGTGGQDYVDTTNHVIYHCSVPGQNWVNIGLGSSGSGGGVTSFTGDGTFITNSASTGAVTATLGTLPAANGGAFPIFSTAATGVSMVSAGTNTQLATASMVTPGAAGTYRFVAQLIVTTAGSGGTCNLGTVSVNLSYKDADSGITYALGATPNVTFFNRTSGTATNGLVSSSGVPAAANSWYSVPIEIRAAAAVAVQYQVYQAANSNCTTPPVFAVRPALYYLGY